MRAVVLAILAIICLPHLASAEPIIVPIPNGGYSVALTPNEATDFNQVHVLCGDDRVFITFGADLADRDIGRGPLDVAYADCRFANGISVRVKAGYENPPQPFGNCGGNPGKFLSIWIGHHKLVSKNLYVPYCSELVLKSIDVDAQGAMICTLSKADDPDTERSFSELPAKSVCTRVPASGSSVDLVEFSGADTKSGTPLSEGPQAALCAQMIAADRVNVEVPVRFAQPQWQTVEPHDSKIDLDKVGFNATTFGQPGTKQSNFDLENAGQKTIVYQHDEDNHWFFGSALTIDHPGILDVPFDAHDWNRSAKSRIYVWPYEVAHVFFDDGKTYICWNQKIRWTIQA